MQAVNDPNNMNRTYGSLAHAEKNQNKSVWHTCVSPHFYVFPMTCCSQHACKINGRSVLFYGLPERDLTLLFYAGHLRVLNRFAYFSPADSLCSPIRVVVTKALVEVRWLKSLLKWLRPTKKSFRYEHLHFAKNVTWITLMSFAFV